MRFFTVEILVDPSILDSPSLVMRFEGPCRNKTDEALNHSAYRKVMQDVIESDLQTVHQTCERVFETFGDYNYVTNNCKKFVKKIIAELRGKRRFLDRFERRDIEAHMSLAVMPSHGPSPQPTIK